MVVCVNLHLVSEVHVAFQELTVSIGYEVKASL